jgi:putative PIN family toxin of toxin-antitoxin system
MGTKIVVDTNVLVSALGWEGPEWRLFRRVLNGEFELLTSARHILELERVLDYPRLSFSEEMKTLFMEIVFEVCTMVDVYTHVNVIEEDPEDNMLLDCAIDGGAAYLITGDQHLLQLCTYRGVRIMRAREFLRQHN